jgi:hypothetical protein
MQKKWAYIILLLVVGVTGWLASTLPSTRFDYDFDKFFKPDEAATQYFEQHRATFGTDNDFVLIGVVAKQGIFNTSFYNKLEALSDTLAGLPHVIEVISPTSLRVPIREPLTGAIFQKKVLSGNFERDALNVSSDPGLADNFFASDTAAVSILLRTSPKLSKEKCDELTIALDEALAPFNFDGIHLAGRAIGQVVYINKIQKEFSLFMAIAMVLVVILLYAMFKSFRGIVLPMVTVLLAVVWSIGILNLAGSGIGILLNMLPPVIFVVGMSDAVHLYARYLEELKRGSTQQHALRLMIFDTGLATLLTSITTAIGFASLYFTGIPTLQEFGLLTAAGVLAAYIIAITLMPAWLSLTKPPQRSLNHKGNLFWDGFLQSLFPKVIQFRRQLMVLLVLLTAVFMVGGSQLDLDNYLLEDLKPSEKLRQDFTFFDRHFAGVRPFELGIKLKDSGATVFSPQVLTELDSLEVYLRSSYGAAAISSVVTVSKSINRTYNGGRNSSYKLPSDSAGWQTNLREMRRLHNSKKLEMLVDSSASYLRISGRVSDLGGKAFGKKNAALMAHLDSAGLSNSMNAEVTGTGTLIDRTNQNWVFSLGKGLGVAFALIALIMGFMFKSVRMVGVALVPNILPLLAVASTMWLLDIDLKMSTSIIFTIAFGIAVDDTIHLLSRYKLELRKGESRENALRNAFIHTGKALIITTIILLGGFVSLCFSTFQSTFYIGLFVSLTLIFALLFDLSLLPALISYLPKGGSNGDLHLTSHNANHSHEHEDTQNEIQIPRKPKSSTQSGE